jgi:ABC-type branched-subunit amino acid transport system ATPase component
VPLGKITGLIGPNGAGKTSAFNACSGMNSRYDGTVRLHGRDISRLAPAARARIGLGRTFQRFELCDNLTVFENVMLGSEAPAAGANALRQLAASPKQKRKHAADTARAIRTCGLEDVVDASVGLLSTGHRRLVELARCLAGPFDVLLLDEPTSGLDRAETERFADTLRGVVRDKGVSILLVEHDMSFVMDLCERIYVMDFGESIFYGSPSAVQASELVQAAYLGGGGGDAEPAPAEVVEEHG